MYSEERTKESPRTRVSLVYRLNFPRGVSEQSDLFAHDRVFDLRPYGRDIFLEGLRFLHQRTSEHPEMTSGPGICAEIMRFPTVAEDSCFRMAGQGTSPRRLHADQCLYCLDMARSLTSNHGDRVADLECGFQHEVGHHSVYALRASKAFRCVIRRNVMVENCRSKTAWAMILECHCAT